MDEKTIIDNNGYIVERCVLVDDNNNIKNHTLQEGEKIVIRYLDKFGLVKPQWNGTTWIETATQEEINSAYPSIDEVKENKINELDSICKNKIYNEFYSSADGTNKLYDLDTDHQVRIATKKFEILFAQSQGKTVAPISYYAKGEDCHDYSAEQFLQLVQDAENWITENTTKYKNLKNYINTLTTVNEINSVTFDTEIPSTTTDTSTSTTS
jgi:hypothetical protein